MICEGLVFAVPLGDGTYGFGQVVRERRPIFYMVAFHLRRHSHVIDPAEVATADTIMAGNFFDVLIRRGRWASIGATSVASVPFPTYKVKIGPKMVLESWDGTRCRDMETTDDADGITFRANHGPIILENAMKAHFGLASQEGVYETLKLSSIEKTASLV